jgi:hypothetical protein
VILFFLLRLCFLSTKRTAPLYRISIDLTTAKNPRSTNEIIFFPSTNTALGGDFYSYPLLLCRGDSQLLLFMREWIQGFFNCTVSRNPVSAKVLRHFITWYSQEMYNVAAEDQEDGKVIMIMISFSLTNAMMTLVYDLLASPGETKLEYYLEGVPDLQHISIKIKAVDLLRLEESVHKSQDHAIDAIERFVLENASVNIGALTLRTVMTTLVALHLDGKIKVKKKTTKALHDDNNIHLVYGVSIIALYLFRVARLYDCNGRKT